MKTIPCGHIFSKKSVHILQIIEVEGPLGHFLIGEFIILTSFVWSFGFNECGPYDEDPSEQRPKRLKEFWTWSVTYLLRNYILAEKKIFSGQLFRCCSLPLHSITCSSFLLGLTSIYSLSYIGIPIWIPNVSYFSRLVLFLNIN